MEKEMTPETQEQTRLRLIFELKIMVNRGDVDPYGDYVEVDKPDNGVEVDMPDNDVESDCSTKIKELTEENQVLKEKLSKFENS